MKLQTHLPLAKAENQIGYDSRVLLMGSCFSENIGEKLAYFKFRSLQNPFGILFHPKAIENLFERAVEHREYGDDEVFFLNDHWQSFDVHSNLSAISREEALHNLKEALQNTAHQIEATTHIIITLGTAWVYRHLKTKKFVANCHKVPQKEFTKELLSIDVIAVCLGNIMALVKVVNPKVQFIFTVSPVRHLKDGFVENQRSKAHLIAGIHQILESSNAEFQMAYFPAYEIMMDELRDYRFYESDMLHPNPLAIDYIWEKFMHVWIAEKAHGTMAGVDDVQKALQHRAFHPDSEHHQKFKKTLAGKITYLQQEHPFMAF
tara:strand:+ start:672 stop:1628 length:957 start_codon:yes stop_codon:yes gene_type:complete